MSLPNHLFLYSQLLSLIGQGVTTVPVEVELPGILCVGVSQMYNQVLKRTKPSGTAANFASTERADELRGTISLEESFVVLFQVRLKASGFVPSVLMFGCGRRIATVSVATCDVTAT